jgi:hypothetical protein
MNQAEVICGAPWHGNGPMKEKFGLKRMDNRLLAKTRSYHFSSKNLRYDPHIEQGG